MAPCLMPCVTTGMAPYFRSELDDDQAWRHACYHHAMEYDLDRLNQLGRRHQRLRADLEALRPELADEIRAAHAAEVPQVEIARATGYTRDQVRQICLPPTKRRHR